MNIYKKHRHHVIRNSHSCTLIQSFSENEHLRVLCIDADFLVQQQHQQQSNNNKTSHGITNNEERRIITNIQSAILAIHYRLLSIVISFCRYFGIISHFFIESNRIAHGFFTLNTRSTNPYTYTQNGSVRHRHRHGYSILTIRLVLFGI